MATPLSGTCTDNAGNTSSESSFAFKYDSSAPTGVLRPQPRSRPERLVQPRGRNQLERIGHNSRDRVLHLDRLQRARRRERRAEREVHGQSRKHGLNGLLFPQVRRDCADRGVGHSRSRSTNTKGGTTTVGISWSGTRRNVGIGACTRSPIAGLTTEAPRQPGSCTDKAGNASAIVSLPFKYDATGPVVTPSAGRAPDANGWYNHPVSISWSGADPVSGVATCSAASTYSSPDNAAASVPGACTDNAGNTTSASFPLKYDGTAPTMTATPARAPDSNGWYNHQVAISWSGSRTGISGIDTCSAPMSYAGPDAGNAAAGGTCTDKAGNVGSSTTQIKFDATPPVVSPTPAGHPTRTAGTTTPSRCGWTGADPASGVDSCTASAAYNGPDDATASTSGTCTDKAGNATPMAVFPFKFDATAPVATGPLQRERPISPVGTTTRS